ncbi:hypothetical protein [Halostella salina]|uniref:hypothetical protein n=1 Tax=Halostella salina TaxID=1547897 RepID=UPI0013CF1D86|nr:hypothetical protein [Halostella salina]
MTLRCECGGPVRVTEGSDPDRDGRHWEEYECEICSRVGTYEFGGGVSDRVSGCLTKTSEVPL